MSRERRHPRPASWLAVIQAATAAFTGQARLLEDKWIPAEETSFRGAGYRLAAEIKPQHTLFGLLPGGIVRLQGETPRAPDARITLDAPSFPPDTLRQEAYWNYARADVNQPVLVILSEPTLVRLLTGPVDDLPPAVTLIHHWTELKEAETKSAVLTDLTTPGLSPVAYIAGFELLVRITPDLPGLFNDFVSLPDRPGAAIQGILDELYVASTSLSGAEIMALGWRLLDGWVKESDPAALSSYLLWFDAHRSRTWIIDQKMRERVMAEAKRSSSLKFSGPYAESWKQQVQYYASVFQ